MSKRQVWKFPIRPNSIEGGQHRITFEAPNVSRCLTIALQREQPMLWMEVDPDAPLTTHTILCIGTGHGAVPEAPYKYFCSLVEGSYVWHFYI